jgi:choline dehydrogenase-like flavoprotein
MALVTSTSLKPEYDAVIVGSGAGGGQVAYTLTLEGLKVLVLEAGKNYDPASAPMFKTPDQAPLRAAPTPDKQVGFYDATVDGGNAIPGEPYTQASAEANRQFYWWRARMLGGRTNHWTRVTFRYSEHDLKPRSRDGLGADWPVGYADLAPYYDKAEMLVGVFGTNEGLETMPDSPEGCLLPPPRPLVGDRLFRERAAPLGIGVHASHKAILTRRLDSANLPARLHPGNAFAQRIVRESMESRAACFYATDCVRGCAIRANYQSPTVHLPPALATGNLDILCGAMAREVTLGKDGRASGVTYIDKATGAEGHVRGRVVVLAAGSAETVRLLLNSRSPRFPQGLANSSGLVGRYFMDSVDISIVGQIPALEGLPPDNEDGASGGHVYAPWWLHREQRAGKLPFARGYHVQFYSGRQMPALDTLASLEWLTGGSYGRWLKKDARRYYGSFVRLQGLGEMIPNEGSFCELDPEVKDRWGIPVLRFHWKWSDQEMRQAEHMQRTFADVIGSMGGRVRGRLEEDYTKILGIGGATSHEVGGARMGRDPSASVTDPWSRTHDVSNLFLADGSVFATSSDKNPTLTILALAWRAADRIVAELRRGDL